MAKNPMHTGVHFNISIRRQVGDPRWVLAQMRRRWFDVSERAAASAPYAETWVDVTGMTEAEVAAAVLHDLRLAILDRLG